MDFPPPVGVEHRLQSAGRAAGLCAAAIAVLFLFGVAEPETARGWLVAFPAVTVVSGLLTMAAARRRTARARTAWGFIGGGVALWGGGQALWWVLDLTTPGRSLPGAVTLIYVLAYPMIVGGVVTLPHARPPLLARIRHMLDVAAVGVAVSAIVVVVAGQGVSSGVAATPGGWLIGMVAGDIVLLAVAGLVMLRPAEGLSSASVSVLAMGLSAIAVADILFVAASARGGYSPGGQLDAVWVLGYAGIALAATARPPATAEVRPARVGTMRLIAPYSTVVLLLGLQGAHAFGLELDPFEHIVEFSVLTVVCLIVIRQLLAIQENREMVERERDALVASVSHELRTPLTAISGFAAMLNQGWRDMDAGSVDEMLKIVDDQSAHLTRVVTDLIDVARERLEQAPLNLGEVHLSALLEAALAASGADAVVDAGVDGIVWGDPTRLRQVVVNLLSNARRYGRGRVLVRMIRSGPAVRIEVHDDGPGVPRRYQDVIWERFERGPHRLDSRISGSGLGLAIVKSLVESHGGTAAYRPSERLGGACFVVTLPLARTRGLRRPSVAV